MRSSFALAFLLLLATQAIASDWISSPRRKSLGTNLRRSGSSALLVTSVSPRENPLGDIPTINLEATSETLRRPALSNINLFGAMTSSPRGQACHKRILEDRTTIEIAANREISIVHDGRFAFWIRLNDCQILGKAYCGHIDKAFASDDSAFVEATILGSCSERLLSVERAKFKLTLEAVPRATLVDSDTTDIQMHSRIGWGAVIDAFATQTALFILEDRSGSLIFHKIDTQTGGHLVDKVIGEARKQQHNYFIGMKEHSIEVVYRKPDGSFDRVYTEYN